MTTARTLIIDAIIDIGKHDIEETPEDAVLAWGLRHLNRMIGEWSTDNLLIPYSISENFSLSSGTASYTMGSGGTASGTRAMRLLNCYITDSNGLSYTMDIIDQRKYNKILDKDLGGRPDRVFYDPLYATGYLYFYKVPDAAGYTAYIESQKVLHSTLALTTTVSLPLEYENLIVLGLRNRLAPGFGAPVTGAMDVELTRAKTGIRNINIANRLEEMDMPAGVGGPSQVYDIESE